MYDQFKELADVDITKGPMEVGPTTHYVMGGIRVEAETGASTVPGLFAAGECAGGLHGANRLGGNSLSDLIVFGKRAGEHAAAFAKTNGAVQVDDSQAREAARRALTPLEHASGENPYSVQSDLQILMQEHVVTGNREFNPGWHVALDLPNLLTCARAVTLGAIERRESRGGHFREDFPDKDPAASAYNLVIRKGSSDEMLLEKRAIPPVPPASIAARARLPETRARRPPPGNPDASSTTPSTSRTAWSCSTPCTRSRRSRRATSRAGGTARPASAARVPRRSTEFRSSCA
jgi:succinate dehydrogenase / fumarate reductase flavoprotein subunit